jgi:hypothetical protein
MFLVSRKLCASLLEEILEGVGEAVNKIKMSKRDFIARIFEKLLRPRRRGLQVLNSSMRAA